MSLGNLGRILAEAFITKAHNQTELWPVIRPSHRAELPVGKTFQVTRRLHVHITQVVLMMDKHTRI